MWHFRRTRSQRQSDSVRGDAGQHGGFVQNANTCVLIGRQLLSAPGESLSQFRDSAIRANCHNLLHRKMRASPQANTSIVAEQQHAGGLPVTRKRQNGRQNVLCRLWRNAGVRADASDWYPVALKLEHVSGSLPDSDLAE